MSKDVNVNEFKFDDNEVKAAVLNIDMLKQIFDLWYEIFFLRAVMSFEINNLKKNNTIQTYIFDEARKVAQRLMKEKFPSIDLDYVKK